MTELPEDALSVAVLEADRRLHIGGYPLRERLWKIGPKSWEVLTEGVAAGNDQERTHEFDEAAKSRLKSIYGERAFSEGFGKGLTEFRGVGYLFHFPRGYGRVKIDPLQFVDLTPVQKSFISQDPFLRSKFIGHFEAAIQINVRPGSDNQGNNPEKTKLSRESIRNYRAACYILATTKDHADAFQSMCIALELGMKQLLLGRGFTEDKLSKKPFGHDLNRLGTEILKLNLIRPEHSDEIRRILAEPRSLVDNRYGNAPITSIEALRFCLDGQFILREISIAEAGPCLVPFKQP